MRQQCPENTAPNNFSVTMVDGWLFVTMGSLTCDACAISNCDYGSPWHGEYNGGQGGNFNDPVQNVRQNPHDQYEFTRDPVEFNGNSLTSLSHSLTYFQNQLNTRLITQELNADRRASRAAQINKNDSDTTHRMLRANTSDLHGVRNDVANLTSTVNRINMINEENNDFLEVIFGDQQHHISQDQQNHDEIMTVLDYMDGQRNNQYWLTKLKFDAQNETLDSLSTNVQQTRTMVQGLNSPIHQGLYHAQSAAQTANNNAIKLDTILTSIDSISSDPNTGESHPYFNNVRLFICRDEHNNRVPCGSPAAVNCGTLDSSYRYWAQDCSTMSNIIDEEMDIQRNAVAVSLALANSGIVDAINNSGSAGSGDGITLDELANEFSGTGVSHGLTGFYTRQHESLETLFTGHMETIKQTGLVSAFDVDFSANAATLDFNFCTDIGYINLGCHSWELPEYVLSFMRLIILITAGLTARKIIVG